MKRWLLILLVALVPLQFGWAGVSASCADEAGLVHLHEAESHADSLAGAADDEAGGCQHCHAHLTPLPSRPLLLAAADTAAPLRAAPCPQRTSAPAPRPERPQWPARA